MGFAKPEDPLCAVATPEELVWLERHCAANGYIAPTPMGDGRYACLSRFLFTCAIITGDMFDDWGYRDRWCFNSIGAAMLGLVDWINRGFEGEPTGWHRHPDSGRRRPGGNESQEYVAQ